MYASEGAILWAQEKPNDLQVYRYGQPRQTLTRGHGEYLSEEAGACTRIPTGHPEGYLEAFATIYCGVVDQFYRGQGCSRCRGTGFAGRIGIFELIVPDEHLLASIANGANLQELREQLGRSGFVTLRADGMEKVKAGLTSLEELFTATTM